MIYVAPLLSAFRAEHDCLGFSILSAAPAHEWSFGENRETRVAVQGPLKANNGDALVAAAVCGLGILYEPEFIVADPIRSGLLEPISLDQPTADLGGIHVAYPPGRTPPAKVRVMIDFLVEAFGTTPPWSLSRQAAD